MCYLILLNELVCYEKNLLFTKNTQNVQSIELFGGPKNTYMLYGSTSTPCAVRCKQYPYTSHSHQSCTRMAIAAELKAITSVWIAFNTALSQSWCSFILHESWMPRVLTFKRHLVYYQKLWSCATLESWLLCKCFLSRKNFLKRNQMSYVSYINRYMCLQVRQ